MLKEILYFHQFYLEPHMKNDNEDYNDDNDYILLSSGYSIPYTIPRALHTYSRFISLQLHERMLSQCSHFTDEEHWGTTRLDKLSSSNGPPVKGLPFDSR